MKTDKLERILKLLFLASMIALLGSWFIKPLIHPGKWEVVRQRTNDLYRAENYGFRMPDGTIFAGFSNAPSARSGMEVFRHERELAGKKSMKQLREEYRRTRRIWDAVP